MVAALIQLTQGSTVGVAGQALFGLAGSNPVVVENADDAGVDNWTYTIVDAPTGSAIPIGVAQDGPTPTFAFTPDVSGGYLIGLTVADAGGADVATDLRVFGVVRTSGRFIPPFSARAAALNFAGQLRGWAPYMEAWLVYLDGLAAGGSSPWVAMTINGTIAPGTGDVSVAIDTSSNPVNVNIPTDPAAGDLLCIKWTAGTNLASVSKQVSGTSMENPYQPGQFANEFHFRTLGDSATWKYDGNSYLLRASALTTQSIVRIDNTTTGTVVLACGQTAWCDVAGGAITAVIATPDQSDFATAWDGDSFELVNENGDAHATPPVVTAQGGYTIEDPAAAPGTFSATATCNVKSGSYKWRADLNRQRWKLA